jgi:hypothetical protein
MCEFTAFAARRSVVTYGARGGGGTVPFPAHPYGEWDVLNAFEELEALRWIGQVRRRGRRGQHGEDPAMPVL